MERLNVNGKATYSFLDPDSATFICMMLMLMVVVNKQTKKAPKNHVPCT
jgi:hypothetical protein